MNYKNYIIYSKKLDRFYIGHSSYLNERIRKHNSNHKGFTGKANDWILMYHEEFISKTKAYKRELLISAIHNTSLYLMTCQDLQKITIKYSINN